MGKKYDLRHFERGVVVGATRACLSVSETLSRVYEGWCKNKSQAVNYEQVPVLWAEMCFVDGRGQKRMDRLVWTDRKAMATQVAILHMCNKQNLDLRTHNTSNLELDVLLHQVPGGYTGQWEDYKSIIWYFSNLQTSRFGQPVRMVASNSFSWVGFPFALRTAYFFFFFFFTCTPQGVGNIPVWLWFMSTRFHDIIAADSSLLFCYIPEVLCWSHTGEGTEGLATLQGCSLVTSHCSYIGHIPLNGDLELRSKYYISLLAWERLGISQEDLWLQIEKSRLTFSGELINMRMN